MGYDSGYTRRRILLLSVQVFDMGIIGAFFRRRRLRVIEAVLGHFQSPAALLNELASGKVSVREWAEDDLWDLCELDYELHKIMAAHGANRDTLRQLRANMLASGAGQWAGEHYVAVAAIGTPHALQFLLQQSGKLSWIEISALLIEYFERKDIGPVPLTIRGPM